MAKVVALSSNKGGVLKTSLAINLAGSLATQGKKTLIINTSGHINNPTYSPSCFFKSLNCCITEHCRESHLTTLCGYQLIVGGNTTVVTSISDKL